MNPPQKHITVEISRRAFAANIRHLRSRVAPAKLCVVMKSDAYGHGLRGLVDTAVEAGADVIGICTNDEAALVREHQPNIPVMRLRAALAEELEESAATLEVQEIVGSVEVAERIDQLGRERRRPMPVHLKLDTGMGRTGFRPDDLETIRRVSALPGLQVCGIMTHLAQADAADLESAHAQLDEFNAAVGALRDDLHDAVIVHSHNSAATVRLPERRGGLVRVGAACYGVRTSTDFENPAELQPVMTVRTRVLEVRDVAAGRNIGYGALFQTNRQSKIASLPVGFGEGYPRSLFNKGIVLIRGQRCPVVGRVSLNVTTVDVTDLDGAVLAGDEAILVGGQGAECVTFEELADLIASVHTEIHLMAGGYNQRVYLD